MVSVTACIGLITKLKNVQKDLRFGLLRKKFELEVKDDYDQHEIGSLNYIHQYELSIPVANSYAKWLMIYECGKPNVPPEFHLQNNSEAHVKFNDVSFLKNSEEMWNSQSVDFAEWLKYCFKTLTDKYKEYQIEKANNLTGQINCNYMSLFGELSCCENEFEVHLMDESVELLVNVRMDLSEYVTNFAPDDLKLNVLAIIDQHVYEIRPIKMPGLEALTENGKDLDDETFNAGFSDAKLKTYVRNIIKTLDERCNFLENRMVYLLDIIVNSHANEYMFLLDYDNMNFTYVNFTLKNGDQRVDLTIDFPYDFPYNMLTCTLKPTANHDGPFQNWEIPNNILYAIDLVEFIEANFRRMCDDLQNFGGGNEIDFPDSDGNDEIDVHDSDGDKKINFQDCGGDNEIHVRDSGGNNNKINGQDFGSDNEIEVEDSNGDN